MWETWDPPLLELAKEMDCNLLSHELIGHVLIGDSYQKLGVHICFTTITRIEDFAKLKKSGRFLISWNLNCPKFLITNVKASHVEIYSLSQNRLYKKLNLDRGKSTTLFTLQGSTPAFLKRLSSVILLFLFPFKIRFKAY